MLAILVTVPTVMQNSLRPLSTSYITACHLVDFMEQRKITSGLSVPPPLSSPILRRKPFLLQPSEIILVWDRHRIMRVCIPSCFELLTV